MAVVAALKLYNLVASGIAAGQADCTHGGLGAGVDHAYHLHAGNGLADFIRQGNFQFCGGAKGHRLFQLFANRIQHHRVAVSKDHRPPGHHIIDIAFAIGIVHIGTFGALEKYRCSADSAKGPHRRVHSTGNMLLCCCEKLFGTRMGIGH